MADYYLSPTGNNANPGTQAQPWQTIDYGANSSPAANGDRLLLAAGATFNQDVNITRARDIEILSADIYNPATVVPQTTEFRVLANNWTLRNFIVTGSPTIGIRVGSATTIVDNVTIENMVVKHCASHAIHARNVTNFIGRRNILYDCRTRISGGAGAHGFYCATRMDTAQIYKNYIFDMGADGYQCDAGITSVSAVQIYDNVIFIPRPYGSRDWHDFLTNVGESGIDLKAAIGGILVYRNRCYGIYATVANQDSGGTSPGGAIGCHVDAENIDFWENLVWDCGLGFSTAQGGGAGRNNNIRFWNNAVIDPSTANGATGMGFSFAWTDNLIVENNTVICTNAAHLYLNAGRDVDYDRMRNNIFYSGNYSRSTTNVTGEANIAHNCYPNVAGGPPAAWNNDTVSTPTPAFDAEYVPGVGSSFINAGQNMALIRDLAQLIRGRQHTMGAFEPRTSQPSNQNLFGEIPGMYGYLPGMFTTFVDGDGEINLYPIRELNYGFGLAIKIQDTTVHYIRRTVTNSPTLRHRFYLEPYLFQMANSTNLTIANLRRSGSPHTRIELRYTGGSFFIVASTDTDGGTQTYIGSSSGFAITRAVQRIEFQLTAASAPGANNGTFQLWINGTSQGQLTGLDNDTRTTDEMGWGAITIPAGCGNVEEEFGTFWMHSLAANNTGLEIGPVNDTLPALPVIYENDSRLRGYWQMSEAAGQPRADRSGYNNNFEDINTVGYSSNGGNGGAADFEAGSDTYLRITNTVSGLNPTGNALTVLARVRPESLPGFMYLFNLWNPTTNQRSYRLAVNGSNQCNFAVSGDGINADEANSQTVLATNTYYWLAGSYGGTVMWAFVNGLRDGNPVFRSGNLFGGPAEARAGSHGGGGSYYDGLIDELVFAVEELSAAEIYSISLNGIQPTAPGGGGGGGSGGTLSGVSIYLNALSTRTNLWQGLAPTVLISDPLWWASRVSYIDSVAGRMRKYKHVIKADGGYWDAEFSLNDRIEEWVNWHDNGLGRHIEVYNHAGDVIWEGFVNEIEIVQGDLTLARGKLLDIANYAIVAYSTIDYSVNPPAFGQQAVTAAAQDANSQAIYGVIQKRLNSGGMTAPEADQVRDTWLAENKLPEVSQQLSNKSGREMTINIRCLGYYHLLAAYYYANAGTGTQAANAKIQAIMAAHPNGIFSTDYSGIAANSLAVPVGTGNNNNDKALSILKNVVARGDANDVRYTFGIYQGRKAQYQPIPSTFEYQRKLSDRAKRVFTPWGHIVYPWDVLPAKLMLVSDFLVGGVTTGFIYTGADIRQDSRAIFIESVTYTFPWGIDISGGKTDSIPQKLAKLGLGGLG